METKELLKDYIDILCEDAELTYRELAFENGEDNPDCPEGYEVPQEVLDDAKEVVEKFHAAFPDANVEGGEIYMERIYADGGLPLKYSDWIDDNIEPPKGTPEIYKADEKYFMEVV